MFLFALDPKFIVSVVLASDSRLLFLYCQVKHGKDNYHLEMTMGFLKMLSLKKGERVLKLSLTRSLAIRLLKMKNAYICFYWIRWSIEITHREKSEISRQIMSPFFLSIMMSVTFI